MKLLALFDNHKEHLLLPCIEKLHNLVKPPLHTFEKKALLNTIPASEKKYRALLETALQDTWIEESLALCVYSLKDMIAHWKKYTSFLPLQRQRNRVACAAYYIERIGEKYKNNRGKLEKLYAIFPKELGEMAVIKDLENKINLLTTADSSTKNDGNDRRVYGQQQTQPVHLASFNTDNNISAFAWIGVGAVVGSIVTVIISKIWRAKKYDSEKKKIKQETAHQAVV